MWLKQTHRRIGSGVWPLLLAVMIAGQFCAASAAATEVRTIAVQGQNPFGAGESAAFGALSTPSINNRGELAFTASLTGSSVTTANDSGLWVGSENGFSTVAREGSAAPGYPVDALFGAFSTQSTFGVPLNDAGRVAFAVSAGTLPPVNTSGVWSGDSGGLSLVARQGEVGPGATDNATFTSFAFSRPTLNRAGAVAFQNSLSGTYGTPANNGADGVWRWTPGDALEKVALIKEDAVGLAAGAKFTDIRSYNTAPPLNRAGEIAIQGAYSVPGGSTFNQGLWTASGDDLELRGFAQMPAPQLGPAATLTIGTMGGIDANGSIAFNGDFGNATAGAGKGRVIGVAKADGLEIVAYQGGPAPGAGAGHLFSAVAFSYEPTINSAGQVAFYGDEYNGIDFNTRKSGVWAGAPGALAMVAREGDPAPGMGLNFGSFSRNTPAMNRFGQVAFPNTLLNAPAGTSSTLWVTGLDGELELVARSGDTIEVGPGDVRTILSLSMITFHGDEDGKARGLNDLGQVAFKAGFTDGTNGVFVSNVVAHLPGDYDGSGTVDAADFTVWRDGLGSQNLAADGDRNGVVDELDYAVWKDFFGVSLEGGGIGAIAAVPEPSSMLICLLVAGMAICTRFRSH